jgi:hypothetical protein
MLIASVIFASPMSEVAVTYDVQQASITVTSNIPLEVVMMNDTALFVLDIREVDDMDFACQMPCPCLEAMWLPQYQGPLLLHGTEEAVWTQQDALAGTAETDDEWVAVMVLTVNDAPDLASVRVRPGAHPKFPYCCNSTQELLVYEHRPQPSAGT